MLILLGGAAYPLGLCSCMWAICCCFVGTVVFFLPIYPSIYDLCSKYEHPIGYEEASQSVV